MAEKEEEVRDSDGPGKPGAFCFVLKLGSVMGCFYPA